jgi:hypothetical protein
MSSLRDKNLGKNLETYLSKSKVFVSILSLMALFFVERTEILKIVSLERMIQNSNLSNSTIIDENKEGKLVRVISGHSLMVLIVACGTGRRVMIPIRDGIRTVEAAQAWIQSNTKWIKPEVRT